MYANDCQIKNYLMKFIRLYQKTGQIYFDELWVTDSTLNECTNSQVMRNQAEGMVHWV